MGSPFKDLKASKKDIETWGGQYDCMEVIAGRRCTGYAREAKYIPSERVLTWKCQFEHISAMENVDDE